MYICDQAGEKLYFQQIFFVHIQSLQFLLILFLEIFTNLNILFAKNKINQKLKSKLRRMNSTYLIQQNATDYFESWNFSSNIWKILLVFVSVVVCLLTQAGNVLVLLSFRLNKKLRVTNNYFLISLAIADLIIGRLLIKSFDQFILFFVELIDLKF